MAIVSSTNGFTARGLVRGLGAHERPKRLLVLRHPVGPALGPPVGATATGAELAICALEGRSTAEREALLEGVSDLVVLPMFDPEQVGEQIRLVAAARARGVERLHMVSLSGAAPRSPSRCLRWIGLLEAEVIATGLPHTIVRCAPFMQNLPLFLERGAGGWSVVGPFRDAAFPWLDAEDVGAVLATIIARGTDRTISQLSGPADADFDRVAGLLAAQLGQPVTYTDVSSPQAEGRLEARGIGRERARALTEYWDFLVSGVVRSLPSDTVTQWLARPPRPLERFCAELAGELRAAA